MIHTYTWSAMWKRMSVVEQTDWMAVDGGDQCYVGNKYRDMARDARFTRLRRPLWAPRSTERLVLTAVDATMTDEDWLAAVEAQERLPY